MDMSVYLLCKGGFSCDGNSQEDQSQGFRLPSFLRLAPWFPFVVSPDFFLEMNFLFICIHNFCACQCVCWTKLDMHAKAVYFSSDALS